QCPAAAVGFGDLAFTDDLTVNRMRVSIPKPWICNQNATAALNITSASNVQLRDVSMQPSALNSVTGVVLASLNSSSGTLEHFTAPSQLLAGLTLGQTTLNTGPVTMTGFDVGPLQIHSSLQPLIGASQCGAPVTISNNHLTAMVNDTMGSNE